MSDATFREWDIDDPDDCRELARRVIRAFEAMAHEQLGLPDDIPISPFATMSDDELNDWLKSLPIRPA